MSQSDENFDWFERYRPDAIEKPERGVLLKEFDRDNRHPSVYIIWEREFGKFEKIGIVCITSTREMAERRVQGLNKNDFWSGTNFTKQTSYQIEEVEIDHMFAASMMGYDIEADKAYEDISRAGIWYPMSEEGRIERLKESAREKFEEMDGQIKSLEAQLAEALARAEAAENALKERDNHDK